MTTEAGRFPSEPGYSDSAPSPDGLGHAASIPSADDNPPWWFCLGMFFGGLTLAGAAFQILTEWDLPPVLGFPVVVGLGTLGMCIAIGGLGMLLSSSDSDEHRNGEDAQRLSGEAMPARAGTASPNLSSPPPNPTEKGA